MRENEICIKVKTMIEKNSFDKAYEIIVEEIKINPDSALWHNLLGILYEKQGNHTGGMKHFRAAWALDPAFIPARWNMDVYGGMEKGKKQCAYMAQDCQEEIKKPEYRVIYNSRGAGCFEPLHTLRERKKKAAYA